MFLKNSRYYKVGTVTAKDARGREVRAVKLRRLPDTGGEAVTVRDQSQLDVISRDRYKDGRRYWHIADANSELEARALTEETGRVIRIPKK